MAEPMSDERLGADLDADELLAVARAHHAAYVQSHSHPGAFACCSAHATADDVPELLAEIDRLNTVLDANRVVRNAAESSCRTYKAVTERLKAERTRLRAELDRCAGLNRDLVSENVELAESRTLPSITDGITDAEAEASAEFDLTIDEIRSFKIRAETAERELAEMRAADDEDIGTEKRPLTKRELRDIGMAVVGPLKHAPERWDHGAVRPLRLEDEPGHPGAVVAVHYGEPQQEVWVRSRSNIGNWYPLGSEYGRPRPWDDPRSELEKLSWRGPTPRPGPGEVPRHPRWEDVLERGPVTLLAAGHEEARAAGWAAGRRHMADQVEALSYDEEGGCGG